MIFKIMDIKVIKTGSKGNAILVNSTILIDCGIPFKNLQDYYKNIEFILLTHIHSDHFNKAAIKKLAETRPSIKFIACEWLISELYELVNINQIELIQTDKSYKFNDFQLIAKEVKHNVKNCAYKLLINNKKLLFATDLNDLDSIQAKNYDYYLIEANYKESELIERIKEKQEDGQYIYEYDVIKNHLSYEKAINFIAENSNSSSKYILLHQHERSCLDV